MRLGLEIPGVRSQSFLDYRGLLSIPVFTASPPRSMALDFAHANIYLDLVWSAGIQHGQLYDVLCADPLDLGAN